MTTPDHSNPAPPSASLTGAERVARIAGEAVELVSAMRRLRADRADGAIGEAEYRAALAALEPGPARGGPQGAA